VVDHELVNTEVRTAPPHDHAVHVYADDAAISHEIIRFVEDGLVLGESVVVAATAQHRAAIARWRSDHPSISDGEVLLVMDADETLQKFMVAGLPDPALFESTICPIIDRAVRGGRTVRVFGEMVALLWADGNVTGALELEALWNGLALSQRFFLMCAYPGVALAGAPLQAVNAMCDHHSNLSLLGHDMRFATPVTATSESAHCLFVPVLTATTAARQVAARRLVDLNLTHLIPACVIITSALAENAVVHAQSSFRLTLRRDATCLRIVVEDADARLPAVQRAATMSRVSGLGMVDSLASNWGWDATPDGKMVWAELHI
jgi:DcmR-like sensory protein